MTRKKKWKGSKTILSLLLSAMMIAEPFGAAATVYAEEITPQTVEEDTARQESESSDDSLATETEGVKEDNSEETENGTKDDGDVQGIEGDSKSEAGENEGSDPDNTDKGEASENASDTENQNTDAKGEEQSDGEDIPSEEGDAISGNDLESDTISENDLEDENKDDDAEQTADMPADYKLSAAQKRDKEILAGEADKINESDEGVMYAKGEVIVTAGSQEEAEMIAEAYNAEIKAYAHGLMLLQLSEGDTVASTVKMAASTKNRLPAVWPNYYRYMHTEDVAPKADNDAIEIEEVEYEVEEGSMTVPETEDGILPLDAYEKAIASYNDPALSPNSAQYQWQHVAVGSPYAWAKGCTGKGVKVAVLDTGVLSSHPDLTVVAEADATGDSIVTGSGAANDVQGHGTHVAGIIGATADNNIGGAGIAPEASLYGVKVLGDDGRGGDYEIIQGIYQAIDWNVDVINMSLGGPGYNQLCQNAVTEAYNKGIAIFVSAGNDGASCINYPACYEHVICVAATDQNNSRADFSTYGSWVDLSAPGVAIWSTYVQDNAAVYAAEDGTSMACPVAVGEAAVILSGDSSLKTMPKDGNKVDALEKKMKGNVVKASGNGIGAGVTSLTKVFKLSTADVKPQAPEFVVTPDSESQQVTVEIKAQSGMKIYYTDNGKNPVYKNGAADSNTKLYTDKFVIKDSAKGSVKAIAVNDSGVASAVKSVKYTLKPYVSTITITGVQKVAVGKNIQLTAEVLPSFASNKKVKWELYNSNNEIATAAKDNISINSNGKVIAKSTATVGAKYTAKAISTDGSNVVGEYEITVIAGIKIKSIKFNTTKLSLTIPDDKNGHDLFSDLTATTSDDSTVSATDFKWSSSNKKVASVGPDGKVIPLAAGTAKITALADDSSNKKVTCTVTVKQLADSISISGASSIAAGKSVTFKATILPADTTLKKVTWSVVDDTTNEAPTADKGLKINGKNGKLTTTSASKGNYTVIATATDGSEKTGKQKIVIQDGAIASVAFEKSTDKKVTIFRKKAFAETKTSATVNVTIKGTTGKVADLDAYEVSSSNPGIATVTSVRTGETVVLTIVATGRAAGKTNITLVTTDGSNKKVTCAVTVNNPVTKIHITSNTKTASFNTLGINMVVLRGKNLQLKAKLESEYGAISNKKVKWSIDTPAGGKGVSINQSGKVSAKKDAAQVTNDGELVPYTVTAEALDGSGAKATYTVFPVNPATYVTAPALKHPLPGYVWSFTPLANVGGVQQFVDPVPIIQTDVVGGYIEATSSNPKVMEVTVYYNQADGEYYLFMTPHTVKKQTIVTITVKATDGSGKKSSYKVMVTPN